MRRLALLFALALLLAGCGGGETASPEPETMEGDNPVATQTQTQPTAEGDAENGKQIFASAGCGSCHTLEDAGTSGTIGPNLDESKPDLALAIDRVTNGAGAMPPFKDQLSEQEIADVSTYVVDSTSG